MVRCAILQLLMDWSFLFGDEVLGKRCASVLRELNGRHGFALRPTGTAADLYSVIHAEERTDDVFLRGVAFDSQEDWVAAREEHSNAVSICETHVRSEMNYGVQVLLRSRFPALRTWRLVL